MANKYCMRNASSLSCSGIRFLCIRLPARKPLTEHPFRIISSDYSLELLKTPLLFAQYYFSSPPPFSLHFSFPSSYFFPSALPYFTVPLPTLVSPSAYHCDQLSPRLLSSFPVSSLLFSSSLSFHETPLSAGTSSTR